MVPRVWSLMRCVGPPGGLGAPEKVPAGGHPLRFAPDWIFEFRGVRSPIAQMGKLRFRRGGASRDLLSPPSRVPANPCLLIVSETPRSLSCLLCKVGMPHALFQEVNACPERRMTQEMTGGPWKPLEGCARVVPPGAGRQKVRGLKSSLFRALCGITRDPRFLSGT